MTTQFQNPTPGPGIFEWQTAVLESIGIDATKVTSATIVMSGDRMPRVIVEWVPDEMKELHNIRQYRIVEVET